LAVYRNNLLGAFHPCDEAGFNAFLPAHTPIIKAEIEGFLKAKDMTIPDLKILDT